MKQTTPFFIGFLLLFCCQYAAAESMLTKIAKADSKDVAQVFFTFDSVPPYSHKLSSKRVDVLFDTTILTPEVELFAADDRIIRIVPTIRENMTVVSLFFRYQPQKVTLQTANDGKVVLEILLGNRYSRSYQDLSERLKGLTVVEEEQIDFSNPLNVSPYAYNWLSFFKLYEPAIDIVVPIDLTAPPFPVIALIPPKLTLNSELLPADVQEAAGRGQWNELVPQLLGLLQNTSDVEDQKMLALTYGELLLRSKDYEGAYKQLYLLQQKYQGEHVGILAKYLLILLDGRFRDPNLADFEFKELEPSITATHPLAPYLLISRVETSLATRQFEQARLLLNRDDIPFPESVQKLRELRQGDYYNGTSQLVKAYVSYQLLRDTPLLEAHPYSLNGYCGTLYKQKKYEQAAACYRELAPLVSASEQLGLISYRTSMAELHFKPGDELIASFARIEDAFPDSEAGARAAIKQTDLKYLKLPKWGKQAARQYNEIATSSVKRPTVAEASFKEAIVYAQLGEKGKSIELLLDFLRNFKHSEIHDNALALLIDILPDEIKRLLGEGKNMEALVLAKKNRDLFQNNWLDLGLLAEIATAYQMVGIYSEAQRVYLYLLEFSDAEKREQFFLPLVQSVFEQGDYGLVEDFGSQYVYNYPEGKDYEPILTLRLKALVNSERFDQARALLPSPLPEQTEIRLLAADIFFHDQNYRSTRETLESLSATVIELPVSSRFKLAESRYQLADYPGAEQLFLTLVDDETVSQQSLYRLAQIERSRGQEQNALKLFERIVEKGTDNLWKRYAEKELEYSRLNRSIEKMVDG